MMRKISDLLSTDQIMTMSNLNTKQEKVIYLVGLDLNLSNEEIAHGLNTSVASVQSMISRGKTMSTMTQRFNGGVITDNTVNAAAVEPPTPKKPFVLKVEKIGNMEFPTYECFRTGTIIDKMLSDHTEEGGAYSGCVYVVPGESGSGKSTWLIDFLVKIMDFMNIGEIVSAKPVYVSGEMTRNDLYFYKQKMPGISKVDTLLCNEYMRDGQLSDSIEAIFKSPDYNIIVLDSYQDIVEKMRDAYNMKESAAENWLINLMVEAAENQGKLIFAIQHMTKGGQYVGGTFLKHVTTGMIFVKKDKVNPSERYIEVSKNRRGGSMTDRPLYFYLRDGGVSYDEGRFNSETAARNSTTLNSEVRTEMADNFTRIFDFRNREVIEPTDAELDAMDQEAEATESSDEFVPTEDVGMSMPVGNVEDAVLAHDDDPIIGIGR